MNTPETDEIVQSYHDQRESVDGIIEHAESLERERDEARKQASAWRSFCRLKESNIIIRNLLAINSLPLCENLHHSKKDRHEYDEDCPVMKRANAYIAHAEAFISSQNAEARHAGEDA